MTMRSTGENAYFAASNSATGFQSYYRELFDAREIDEVYAVKGGPGTGKSRFLREVAAYAAAHGWRVDHIYCSSDPDSLDAVILRQEGRAVALLDATAPHVYEPSYPGAREHILNLGVFWDPHALAARMREIESLCLEKSDAYRRAYRYLAAYGEVSKNRDALVLPYVKKDRIRAAAQRLMQGVPMEAGYQERIALMRSFGMRGEVSFDTYLASARQLVVVEDCHGTAQYLMAELREAAYRAGLSVCVSKDPIEPHKTDGLLLETVGTAFVVVSTRACERPHKRLDMRRFTEVSGMKPIRKELNFTERMRRAMLEGAGEALEQVRNIHFQLEDIYSAAMDFEAKERFTQAFCEEHFA